MGSAPNVAEHWSVNEIHLPFAQLDAGLVYDDSGWKLDLPSLRLLDN